MMKYIVLSVASAAIWGFFGFYSEGLSNETSWIWMCGFFRNYVANAQARQKTHRPHVLDKNTWYLDTSAS